MTLPSLINISMPKFTWIRNLWNQWRDERRNDEMLVEETDDVIENSTKNFFPPHFNRTFYTELILLILAFLMFTGMIVTSLMLVMHDGRSRGVSEELPSAFELKHTRISNLSICLTIFKTSDESGACLVHTDKNFYDAQLMCDAYGMELLEIDSEDTKLKIFEETKNLFGSGGGTRLWINGKWSKDKKEWLAYPKNLSFFLTSDHVEEKGWGVIEADGNCLAVETIRVDKYQISSCNCEGRHYFYCGY